MSTIATTPLVPKQIDSVMQNVALDALGIDPAVVTNAVAYSKVRIGWQKQGQPAWKIDEDVVIIRSVEEDDPYNRIRDEEIDVNVDDPTTLLDSVGYTRVWRVFWTLYGPASFDNARIIKSALLKPGQDIHDLLVEANLYLVTDLEAPKRVPELYDEQWWERVDFECLFNEQVTETQLVNTVTSVQITVESTGSQANVVDGYDTGGYDEGGFGS